MLPWPSTGCPELLGELRCDSRLTVLLALDDLSVAGQYADRLLMLDGGRVVAEGSPNTVLLEEVIAAHYDAKVRVICDNDAVSVLPRREEARWVH